MGVLLFLFATGNGIPHEGVGSLEYGVLLENQGLWRLKYTPIQNISTKSTALESQSLKSIGWHGATLPQG